MADDRTTACLVYKLGDEPEQIVLWDTVDVTVGRFRTQDLVVPDPEVSREHSVFAREGGRYFVRDCGTGLGTLVNGERVQVQQLAHGDEIGIGPLRVKFALTGRRLRAGGNTRFASQLKAGVAPAASTAGNRTMLGFEPDVPPETVPTVPQRAVRPRALSLAGDLEELSQRAIVPDLGLADLEEFAAGVGAVEAVLGSAEAPAPDAKPDESPRTLRLEVELVGGAAEVEALARSMAAHPLRIGGVELRVVGCGEA